MNIKQFVEESGKEFDTLCNDTSALASLTGGRKIFVKNHHLTKIRELIGELNKEIAGRKGKTPWFPDDFENCNEFDRDRTNYSWNIRQRRINENIKDLLDQQLSSILQLLDEAGGKE